MNRRIVWLVILVTMAVACAQPAFSQAAMAQLDGTVRDQSGALVVDGSISLKEIDTNRSYSGSTNESGFYVVPNLPPGRYQVMVSKSGFATITHPGIVLSVGQTATFNAALSVASVDGQVTVTSKVPTIEPTRTEISQIVDRRQIESLPSSGRLFTDFALLTPGVATGRTSLQSTFTEFEATRVSFAGMRDLSNIVTVDGADNINTVTASQRAAPSQEAVSEFRVVNNSFGAEYGRALGGIVNIVTKFGTNNWHGSAYDYFRNQATDSRSLLQASPQAHTLRQNQFGGTIGGPIKRDKTFIFGNLELQRRAESPTFPITLVNNLAAINTAKAYLGLAPEDLNVLKTADTENGIIKVDHQLRNNHQLSVRYNFEHARDLNQLVGNTLDGGGIGAPSSGHNLFLLDHSLVGSLSSQLSSNVVNTLLTQFARRRYDFPGVTGQPNLDIPNTLLFGHNFGAFDFIGESRLQISDSVAWVRDTHVVNFGGDSNFIRNKVTWPGFTPMRIVLPGLACLQDFANFVNSTGGAPITAFNGQGPCGPLGSGAPIPTELFHGVPIVFWGAPLGTASSSSLNNTNPQPIPTDWQNAYLPSTVEAFNIRLNHSYLGLFVQDQWKITPNLTLNYGLRWDFEGGLTKQINHDVNNFAPRVGIAYSPNAKTVIRAGGGIFFDRYNLSFLFVTFPQRPPELMIDLVNGLPVVPPGTRQGGNTATWALNQEPTVITPTGVFIADAAADARTLLRTGQLPPNFFFPPNGTGGRFLNTVAFEGLDAKSRTSYSEQASLEIDRELVSGLSVSAGYLFASAHKLVRAVNLNVACAPPATATRNNDNLVIGCSGLPQVNGKDFFNGPQYNAGLGYYTDNSGNSVFHGLTLQLNKRAGERFRMNANYTFAKTLDDGTFTTFVSTPENLYKRHLERANSNQDIRHRFIANFIASAPEKTIVRNFEVSSIVNAQSGRPFTIFAGFDANNDTNPVTDRVGRSARNTYYGDKLVSVDLRLSRFFQIRENLRLQLFGEVFNLFNRANVDEVLTVYGAPDFIGPVPKHFQDGITSPANPAFGSARTVFNPRQFQFSAKLVF